MDNFIASILVLYDNINEKTKETDPTKKILNNTITEKQYLAYYLYRIWIKYKILMVKVNGDSLFEEILRDLEIPSKYYDLDVVFPMVDKMVNKESNLNKVILKILKQFNEVDKIYKDSDNLGPNDNLYQQLLVYLKFKSIENIIQDIIQLKVLLPNLSRPASRYNVWNNINKLLLKNNTNQQ